MVHAGGWLVHEKTIYSVGAAPQQSSSYDGGIGIKGDDVALPGMATSVNTQVELGDQSGLAKEHLAEPKYAFIDVETPNRLNASICQIACVVTDDKGIVLNEVVRLVDPEEAFDQNNVRVHGIRSVDVVGQPTFDEVWTHDISPLLRDAIVVAHNANFDLTVLGKCLIQYDLCLSELPFVCTLELSNLMFPDVQSYALSSMCQVMGVQEKHHHNALNDAYMCKDLFWALASQCGLAHIHPVVFEWGSYQKHERLASANSKGAMAELYGILLSISLDGDISQSEIAACDDWIQRNQSYQTTPIFSVIIPTLKKALSDGAISQAEQEQLLNMVRPFAWQGVCRLIPLRSRLFLVFCEVLYRMEW